ncbi:MAG: SAM-dependent methyltransferase, partial [Bacteroidales bacterium]|nr:SAM-dependent methyltransferase [Bacteroidales bacterium]
RLIEGDSLMKFNVVVANPPFSLDKWGADNATADQYNRFYRGVPPKSKGDYAFISHMIETTYEDTGRVGVIMPHGALFRGSSEGKIRKQLIDENLLEAVIGLPANLFFGTGIPASILIYNRSKVSSSGVVNKDVLFIDASSEYDNGKNQNRLRPQDIEKILSTYLSFKQAEPIDAEEGSVIEEKYAYRATLKEVQENDCNLNIPRYVDTFEEEEPMDIAETQKSILELKQELIQVERKMEAYLKELGY